MWFVLARRRRLRHRRRRRRDIVYYHESTREVIWAETSKSRSKANGERAGQKADRGSSFLCSKSRSANAPLLTPASRRIEPNPLGGDPLSSIARALSGAICISVCVFAILPPVFLFSITSSLETHSTIVIVLQCAPVPKSN